MALSASMMEESILCFDDDTMPFSSALESMGIKLNKQNYGARLKGAIDNFNATYLETMDFLTQILPLAKQQFAEPDNILLPKTPAKKRRRHRKHSNEHDKENNNPVAATRDDTSTFKRPTRSSKNSSLEGASRNTRSQTKKVSNEGVMDSKTKAVEPKVTFNNQKNSSDAAQDETKQSPVQKTEKKKRSSSHSPLVKQTTKRTKSDDNLPNTGDDMSEEQTETSLSNENCQTQSSCEPVISIGTEEKSRKSELIVAVESVGNDIVKKTSIDDERNIQLNKSSETEKVPTPLLPIASNDPPKMETNIMNGSDSKKRKSEDCEVDTVTDLGEPVLAAFETKKSKMSSPNERNGKDKIPQVQNILTPTSNTQYKSPRNNTILINETPEKNSPVKLDQVLLAETPMETHGSVTNTNEISLSVQRQVRRSTRLSRRVSKVSTVLSNKRRSSRRLSCRRSSQFKKPYPVKQLGDSPCETEQSGAESDTESRELELKAHAPLPSGHLSAESEEESDIKCIGPTTSTPDANQVKTPNSIARASSIKTDSSSDENDEPLEGKVAEMVQEIDRNARVEGQSRFRTPNGLKKIKRPCSSALKGSSGKPSNLVSGNIRSFIKRQSVKKLDANELVRLKKLELQRKEEKEKERKDHAEDRRKQWVEEQKRKREERQKRVAAAKAARDKEEHEKKQRQVEEKRQMLQVLEQAKKRKEQEEENKKKLREQRKKEADARRLKEQEERMKRLHEKEEEERVYRDMLKRKQEQDEHERKQRIQEEKRLQEQKQRERQREQQEERQRKIRGIKEREQKRVEKENDGEARVLNEKKLKEENERKEKEEREKRQKEQQDREKKRIAQLIKEKMEQEKKLWEEKREKEEKERREREEQRKQREASKMNQSSTMNKSLVQAKSADSYMMTPPPAQTRKPSTEENYDISDIRSDESTDDEDCPRKKVPAWAQGAALKAALLNQDEPRKMFEDDVGPYIVHPPDLDKIFQKKRKRFYYRTSSAHWDTPPIKKISSCN